jgi:hypothetical protein
MKNLPGKSADAECGVIDSLYHCIERFSNKWVPDMTLFVSGEDAQRFPLPLANGKNRLRWFNPVGKLPERKTWRTVAGL